MCFAFVMLVSVASVGETASCEPLTQRSFPLRYADASSEVKRSENSKTERKAKQWRSPRALEDERGILGRLGESVLSV